ncbi:MAG TPA: LysR family transcriptional regulator [Blastocatellia bacterium]|nr:LysR family transcriptional regulator [Blastocatellia bacterium]
MNLQSLDLNLLLAFEALMIERNVTRAARRLNLSQPAMSNALARLRRTFDDPLLLRTREGLKPTPLAQSLLAPVAAALSQLRAALEKKPAFDPTVSQRTFRLLANDYVEILLLPALLHKLHAAAPTVTIRVDRSSNLFQPPPPAALASLHDLALGFFPDALSLESSTHSEFLWQEKNVCIARRAHASIRGRLTLKQYAAASHVAVFYKSDGPGVIDTILAQHGYARRVAAFVPHFAGVPFIVASSDLIATVPERLAALLAPMLMLQVLPAPVAIPPFRLAMLWHERNDRDAAHSWLRHLLVETAMELKDAHAS